MDLELLQEIREKLSTWCFQLDLFSDPDATQFGYCVRCHVAEYRKHREDCPVLELLGKIDKEIAKHGKKK